MFFFQVSCSLGLPVRTVRTIFLMLLSLLYTLYTLIKEDIEEMVKKGKKSYLSDGSPFQKIGGCLDGH